MSNALPDLFPLIEAFAGPVTGVVILALLLRALLRRLHLQVSFRAVLAALAMLAAAAGLHALAQRSPTALVVGVLVVGFVVFSVWRLVQTAPARAAHQQRIAQARAGRRRRAAAPLPTAPPGGSP